MPRQRLLLILLAVLSGIALYLPGCDELITETVEVTTAGNPTAEFGIIPDSGCVPLAVRFDDASSGPVVKWIWNFGDGFYDTVLADSGDVSHTYTAAGTYTVTLSVFDDGDGSDAETKKRAVIVGQSVDSVTLSDTLGCPGSEFTFTAHNPYGIATWRWSYGDGTTSTDSSPVQTHVYDDPGVYPFRLTLTGECGQKILVDTVHILACGTPMFTADPPEGCEPLTVTFVDQSSPPIDTAAEPDDTLGVIVDWFWNFGNGTTLNEQGNEIEVTYSSAGSYPVSLTITTDSGGVTTFVDTIVVYKEPDQAFTAEPLSACQVPGRQFLVKFTREVTSDTAWLWDFGDGYTSDAQSPIHAYTVPGKFNVKMIAYGACGADSLVSTVSNLIAYYDHLVSISFSYSLLQLSDTTYEATCVDESPPATVFTRAWYLGSTPFSTMNQTLVCTLPASQADTITLLRFNDCDSLAQTIEIDIP